MQLEYFFDTIISAPMLCPPTSAASSLALGLSVQELLELASDKSTPWSTPGKRSTPWWNTQLRRLRCRLSWAERLARRSLVPPGASESLFNLRREFKHVVRQARFLFWNKTTRQNDRATARKQFFRATKPIAKPDLPDFGTNGSFHDKCHPLRQEFFPTTIDDLPDLPPG